MDSEIRRELDEIHALVKDNHQMLRAIRRGQLLGFIWKVVLWAVVIIAPLYLYQQYVQPMLEKLSVPGTASATNILGVPMSSVDAEKLLNALKGG